MNQKPLAEQPINPSSEKAGAMTRGSLALLIAGPVAIAIGVSVFWSVGRNQEITDNAYLQVARLPVSASVGGRVVEMAVRENQTVRAGQILFKIDDADAVVSVRVAEAKLADARLRVQSLDAGYQQQQSAVKAARSTATFTSQEAARQVRLTAAGVNAIQEREAAANAAAEARAKVDLAQRQLDVARANLGDRPGRPELYPAVMQASADLDRAKIMLGNTVVRAAADGVVTRVDQLQVGSYINPAQTVFWLVAGKPWVEANFKESQLGEMQVGQHVDVQIDALHGRKFRGRIASFSPGTGAAFSTLPVQNATGNWVKVVQRLPVRIAFAGVTPTMAAAGLSAKVTVDLAAARR